MGTTSAISILPTYRSHWGWSRKALPVRWLRDGEHSLRQANASNEEVIRVAHEIGGGDWIDSLPNGLETEVGERGGSLSMGQRQLVALARVQLQGPSILILDEATASIDPFTETLIQEGLDLVLKDRTSIVTRPPLVHDQARGSYYRVSDGKIIEEGTHDSLLKQGVISRAIQHVLPASVD